MAAILARPLAGARVTTGPRPGQQAVCAALGAASADLLHIYEAVDIQSSPFDPARVMQRFGELQASCL